MLHITVGSSSQSNVARSGASWRAVEANASTTTTFGGRRRNVLLLLHYCCCYGRLPRLDRVPSVSRVLRARVKYQRMQMETCDADSGAVLSEPLTYSAVDKPRATVYVCTDDSTYASMLCLYAVCAKYRVVCVCVCSDTINEYDDGGERREKIGFCVVYPVTAEQQAAAAVYVWSILRPYGTGRISYLGIARIHTHSARQRIKIHRVRACL